jgi:dihydroorotase
MALNLGRTGETTDRGSLADLDAVDVDACAGAIAAHPEGIWGISLNTDPVVCGDNDPDLILSLGVQAAERAGVPILLGNRRRPDAPLKRQLEMLRPGDVMTYCLHPDDQGLIADGQIRDEVLAARERGVLFDSAHGMGSFAFDAAEAAFALGFYPDTISTDQYLKHVGSVPQHDLPRVISKHIAAGMPEAEAFARSTVAPARILGLEGEVGTLAVGACADLAAFHWNEEALPLVDVVGAERPGGCWEPVGVVRGGQEVGV